MEKARAVRRLILYNFNMRVNGGLLSHSDSEWLQLREAWKKWNAKCHYEDRIDWDEYYDEHKK